MADPVIDGFDEEYANSWFELSKSDYARVIFCDLSSYDEVLGVGCRFQISDNVHEDPSDWVGLFRVGWKNLSECLVSKLLSQTECEEDGKMLCCIFKGEELPQLEDGFYQFLYITRDNEVCGASTPFEVKKVSKEESSDEDVVADKTEDDFLVVRSHLFERNRLLEGKVIEMQQKIELLEAEKTKLMEELKKVCEEIKDLIKLKESNATALESYAEQVSKYKTSMKSHRMSTNLYEQHIIDYQEKMNNYEERLNKAQHELRKCEDINLHLTEQLRQMDKLVSEQRTMMKNKDSDIGKENYILAQQLESAKAMLHAAEESKYLAIQELRKHSQTSDKNSSKLNELKVENFALNLKLNDEIKVSSELTSEKVKLQEEVIKLKQVVKDKEGLLVKANEDLKILQDKLVNIDEMASETKSKDEELLQLIDAINELDARNAELKQQDLDNSEALEKMKDKINDLTSNCGLWEDEVNDLKSHCAQLNQIISERESSVLKLKEECIKKEAVIEYITSEKNQLLKTQAAMNETISEMSARLKMAAQLYKQQYIKINSLKKMRNLKSKEADFVAECSTSNEAPSTSQNTSQISDISSHNEASVTTQSSDSDTGEHFRRASSEIEKKVVKQMQTSENANMEPASSVECKTPKAPNVSSQEVASAPPEELMTPSPRKSDPAKSEALHQMIEQNLANLSASCPVPKMVKHEEDKRRFNLPCPMCDCMIEVSSDNTDSMVEHYEKVHKQQMCPICGRLFDMDMPQKYFMFHVDDHYNHENGKKSE